MTDIYGFDWNAGDKVWDLTALANNWPDQIGRVLEVDGTNVLVEYASGTQRWKMSVNLESAALPGVQEETDNGK